MMALCCGSESGLTVICPGCLAENQLAEGLTESELEAFECKECRTPFAIDAGGIERWRKIHGPRRLPRWMRERARKMKKGGK